MSFSWSGAGTGALSGAAAGTAVMPGIGTAIGAVGGGLLGGFFAPEDVNPNQAEINRLIGLQHQNDAVLRNWATTGSGPSQAQPLLEHARADNAANQIGYAKTLGGDAALANRVANDGIARGNAELAHKAALVRSQEQQQAMQNYMQSLQAQQNAALGVANMNAGVQGQNIARQQQWNGQLLQAGAGMAGGGMGGGFY